MDLQEDLVEQFVITITCRKHIPNLIEKLAGAAYILDGAKAVTTARVMTTIPALTDSESADCYILSGTDPVVASLVRLNNTTPKPYTREMAIKRAALLDGTFESLRDVASAAHNEFAEANGGRSKNMDYPTPPFAHKWDADGERCVLCGDKDWMGGPCSGLTPSLPGDQS